MTKDALNSPVSTLLSTISRRFRAEPINGTRTSAVVIASALTALPLVLLIATNYGEIVLIRPIAMTTAAAALISGALAFALSYKIAPHVAGITCGALGYVFFSMSWTEAESTPLLINTWIVVGLVASLIFLWLIGDSARLFTFATFCCAVAVIGLSAWGPLPQSPEGTEAEGPTALAFRDEVARTPNVYLFILDAFSRPSVIEEQFSEFDIDFGPSLARLEAIGFVEEQDARANYAETRLSIPSTMNANYPLVPGDSPYWSARIDGEGALRGHNETVRFLKGAGYDYWHSGSGIWGEAGCDISVADKCIGDEEVNLEAFSAIWQNTPLRQVVRQEPEDPQDPIKVVSLFEAERELSTSDAPTFLFSHLLLPHQPYRFDRNCEPTSSSSTISDGSLPQWRGEYAEQALCTIDMLADAMEELVAADPDALIILQGDHGAGFTLDDGDVWRDITFRERIDTFKMTRLPSDCRYDGPAAQSLINTLPVLYACLTETEPALIEPRIFVTNYSENALYEADHPDDIAME